MEDFEIIPYLPKKHPSTEIWDPKDLIGKKVNDWIVLDWVCAPWYDERQEKYIIQCKCGKRVCMRWQSFTKKTKYCRCCANKKRK